jgi:RNA processing factor Prp31
MGDWLPEKAIAMERRHILEGEKRVSRQEALVGKLINNRHDQLVPTANEVLDLLRETLELSRERLRDLENCYGPAPTPN